MKRVLVIAYYWPPSGGSGVQRWVKMCKYLPSEGWQPVVYTPLNPALTATDSTLGDEIPDEVEVIRRPIIEPGQFARKTVSAQVTPINSQKKTLKQRIAMWIRGNCFIPDPRVLWVRPSVRFLCRYLKEHPADAIVSTGPPHSMHLIAKAVARRTGLPWVADFRDPWTRMFYFKHLCLGRRAERRHVEMELSVLDSATRVVAVSPLVRDDFRQVTHTPVELITNGFDSSDFAAAGPRNGNGCESRNGNENGSQCKPQSENRHENQDRFTLLHAGLFAADGNPQALWEAAGELAAESETGPEGFRRDFRLVLCGKTDAEVLQSIKDAGIGPNLENVGYVDHTAAVRMMRSASVLMLPLRREPEYRATIPGKLFEYLASRRPVIGIGQKDGAMAQILASAGGGETFEWDEKDNMKAWLLSMYKAWKEGELKDNEADLSAYTRKSLAGRYAALLNEITSS